MTALALLGMRGLAVIHRLCFAAQGGVEGPQVEMAMALSPPACQGAPNSYTDCTPHACPKTRRPGTPQLISIPATKLCQGLFPVLLAITLAAASPGPSPAPAANTPQDGLGKRSTQVLVRYYQDAEDWALKCLVLLSLGEHWHPVGTPMIVDALNSKDKRLRCFGFEALHRTRDDVLQAIASREFTEDLIRNQLRSKNKFYRQRVTAILSRIAPDQEISKVTGWTRWWGKARISYEAKPWPTLPKAKKSHGDRKTSTVPFIAKAFDLQASGLDVAIVIDTTGSMQRTIDQSRDALEEIVAMLSGIAPKFRIGLVHYRDMGDMGGGARMLEALTPNVKKVKARLAKMRAGGGGDIPERVEKGLEIALGREMRWKRSANKVIILIGDAPPHPEAIDVAVKLAKDAYENPMMRPQKGPTTGEKKKKATVPPFVTSAIAIGEPPEPSFRRIAEAGGGAFVRIEAGRGRGKGGAGGKKAGKGMHGSRAIVGHILSLSFGTKWQKRMDEFVRLYYEFRDGGGF